MNSIRGTLSGLKKNPEGTAAYDSLLERDYMIELEQDPTVKSWTKKHGIKIPYNFLGLFVRNYLPDFLRAPAILLKTQVAPSLSV